MQASTRRQFLGDIGYGMLLAGLGPTLAAQLTAAEPLARAHTRRPLPRDLEQLIARMQELSADELLPQLVAEVKAGTRLETLVAAGGLANARTFGGSDYEG